MLEQAEKDQRATALLLADSRRENLMTQARTKPKDTQSEGKKRGGASSSKPPTLSQVKARVDFIRKGLNPFKKDESGNPETLAKFEQDQMIAGIIGDDLAQRGTFYRDGDLGFYLDQESRKCIDLGQAGLDFEFLLDPYGLNSTEKLFKYVAVELFKEAIKRGKDTRLRHFSYLAQPFGSEPILYIATEDNCIRRITADRVDKVHNGADGVLLVASKYSSPADIPDDFITDNGLIRSQLTSRIPFDDSMLTKGQSELFLLSEIFALLMRELLTDTRPICAFIGKMGSGKTTAARSVGRILYGPEWDVTDITTNVRDFDTLITTDAFVCFDNVDDKIDWLNNKLAVLGTGGKIARNKLYETHKLIEYPIISMIATTSRTPCFRREDVVDRLIVLKTVRVAESGHGDFNPSILAELMPKRRMLWGEIIYHCQSILRELHSCDWASLHVRGQRMQGFARLSVAVGRAFGLGDVVYEMWEKMDRIRWEFINEDDALFITLHDWVADNRGREVIAKELNDDLRELAQKSNMSWPYKNGKSLAHRLSKVMEDLGARFDIEINDCPNRNQKVYRFYPKGARDSESIPRDSEGDSGDSKPHQ